MSSTHHIQLNSNMPSAYDTSSAVHIRHSLIARHPLVTLQSLTPCQSLITCHSLTTCQSLITCHSLATRHPLITYHSPLVIHWRRTNIWSHSSEATSTTLKSHPPFTPQCSVALRPRVELKWSSNGAQWSSNGARSFIKSSEGVIYKMYDNNIYIY